jgi:hypothetical protein
MDGKRWKISGKSIFCFFNKLEVVKKNTSIVLIL